ncbi:MAG: hypothetical protein AB7G28_26460 [Pirellulales bacterium]
MRIGMHEMKLKLEFAEQALLQSRENTRHHGRQLARYLRDKRYWHRQVELLRHRLAQAEREEFTA